MAEARGRKAFGAFSRAIIAAAGIGLLAAATACRKSGEAAANSRAFATLRVAIALSGASASNPGAGLQQLAQTLSVESLAHPAEDGRFEPTLAQSWTLANNGRSLIVKLRPGTTFHDGSPVNAQATALILSETLRSMEIGPLYDDVDHIGVAGPDSVEIAFRRPSPLLVESLWVRIKKPGTTIVGTGPFMVAPDSTNELIANPSYHLGRPQIDQIEIATFPEVRAAWAELLRDRIDMLFEVPLDALDSLEAASNIAVFKVRRPYQYMLILNTEAPALRPAAVRRALNEAVDRAQLVRQALNQHGVPSSSPISPQYWALDRASPTVQYDPQRAAGTLSAKHVRFTCLIAPDVIYERIALELKRQFAAVGADMDIQSASQDEMFGALQSRRYDAVLFDGISGPALQRSYQLWHSGGIANPGTFGNAAVDAAFDRVRQAENEGDYRHAVTTLQQVFADDPPAVFLAWSERARAVSKRFVVPVETDREILGTLQFWRPANVESRASRN